MNLLEHGNQPLLMDLPVLGGQLGATAQLFQHVVDVGDGQPRVRRLLTLPMPIQRLAQRLGNVTSGDYFPE